MRKSGTFNGKLICYFFGVDGAQLKKVENLTPASAPTSDRGQVRVVTVLFVIHDSKCPSKPDNRREYELTSA
jgi:hypothetical protein